VKLVGHLDRCDKDGLAGWVMDADDPAKSRHLHIWYGAELLGSCVADCFRADLAVAGVGQGRCAFAFTAPPDSIQDITLVRIEVLGSGYCFEPREGRLTVARTASSVYESEAMRCRKTHGPWRKFERCVLHIGAEKTGSTSLQAFFGLNHTQLQKNGMFVPVSLATAADEGLRKHDCLAALSMADDRFQDDLRQRAGINDQKSLFNFRSALFSKFVDEIRGVPSSCTTLILSDEHCHSRLTSTEDVKCLKQFLDHFCNGYQVIVYLRPQHELAISQYGMFVANGLTNGEALPPLPPPSNYEKTIYTNREYFDYAALLDRWAGTFGEGFIHPRLFTAKDLVGGDVVTDFAAKLPINLTEFKVPPRLNTNISARGLAFLLAFYRQLDQQRSYGASLIRERIRNAAQKCFPGPGIVAARSKVQIFCEQFADGNDLLRLRWFPDRETLFPLDLSSFPEQEREFAHSPAEMMEIFVRLLVADQAMLFGLTPDAIGRIARGLPPTTQ
jgi:hypothetical protein